MAMLPPNLYSTTRGPDSDSTEGSRQAIRKGGSQSGAMIAGLDVQPLLCGVQRRRRLQANTGPKVHRLLPECTPFQDGGTLHATLGGPATLVFSQVDLKDTYLTIPVVQEFHQFLAFQSAPHQFIQIQCLLFGLCTAPYVFSKVTKPVVQLLRQQGIPLHSISGWLATGSNQQGSIDEGSSYSCLPIDDHRLRHQHCQRVLWYPLTRWSS